MVTVSTERLSARSRLQGQRSYWLLKRKSYPSSKSAAAIRLADSSLTRCVRWPATKLSAPRAGAVRHIPPRIVAPSESSVGHVVGYRAAHAAATRRPGAPPQPLPEPAPIRCRWLRGPIACSFQLFRLQSSDRFRRSSGSSLAERRKWSADDIFT